MRNFVTAQNPYLNKWAVYVCYSHNEVIDMSFTKALAVFPRKDDANNCAEALNRALTTCVASIEGAFSAG